MAVGLALVALSYVGVILRRIDERALVAGLVVLVVVACFAGIVLAVALATDRWDWQPLAASFGALVAAAAAQAGAVALSRGLGRLRSLEEEQERLLAETLKELDTQQSEVTKLADAWKAGDVATVERIVLQDLKSDARLYQRMLVDRNKNWLPKIEAIAAKGGRPFIVVGAAHLVGSDGLIAMLRGRGYAVEQQ